MPDESAPQPKRARRRRPPRARSAKPPVKPAASESDKPVRQAPQAATPEPKPAPEAAAAQTPPKVKLPARCPNCLKRLRPRVRHGHLMCRNCGEVVGTGEQAAPYVEPPKLLGDALAYHGLAHEDLRTDLPTEGGGGFRETDDSASIRLYTKTKGTLIYRAHWKNR